MGNFAFKLNMKLNYPNFDVNLDADHLMCVQM